MFGSQVTQNINKNSDIDIAVYLLDKKDRKYHSEWGEAVALTTDLMGVLKSDKIDLVVLNEIESEVLKYNIFVYGKLIYYLDLNFQTERETHLLMQARGFMEKHFS